MRAVKVIHRRRKSWIFISLAVVLMVVGIVVFFYQRTSRPQPAQTTGISTGEQPSSVKPKQQEIDSHEVAPGLPRYISIPSINVPKTRVTSLGVNKDNQIVSPSNIYDVGWYKGSAAPGSAGAAFMYAHVSSWTADGIFSGLKKLKPGDRISVERGDGEVFNYEVKDTRTYPADKVDMQAALKPLGDDIQGLNLMTCTGRVIKGTNEFDQRLVIYASKVGS